MNPATDEEILSCSKHYLNQEARGKEISPGGQFVLRLIERIGNDRVKLEQAERVIDCGERMRDMLTPLGNTIRTSIPIANWYAAVMVFRGKGEDSA